jgi:hypothetical protein
MLFKKHFFNASIFQYSSRKACKYNPHGGQTEVEQVKLNLLGLPLRPVSLFGILVHVI